MVYPTASELHVAVCPPKWIRALHFIRREPQAWFRGASMDARDRNLLHAPIVKFVDYAKGSYLRKIYHKKHGEAFGYTDWVVETDQDCRAIVQQGGGVLTGYEFGPCPDGNWQSVTVNVNICGARKAGFDWGFLSTSPSNIRIFRGPRSTCRDHPWDAMILRDCTTNMSTVDKIPHIASRKWDILLMKMCEDFDHPWVVCAVKDAGEFVPLEGPCSGTCSCDTCAAVDGQHHGLVGNRAT